MQLSTQEHVPRHIAVVMDGNGRWAQQRGKRRTSGHRAGVKAAKAVVERSAQLGVEILTLFAFSSENWQRPPSEIGVLMSLFIEALSREVKELHEKKVCLRFIGERDRLSAKLQKEMHESEQLTADNTGMRLFIAVSYGGRWDICKTTRALATDVLAGRMSIEQIDEELISNRLCLGGAADPDLFIRTGGERRISNFLLWNLAYSELYFCDSLWPDFGAEQLEQALAFYSSRQRRFGRVVEPFEE